MPRWITIVLLLLFPLLHSAQVKPYSFRKLSINEGLSQSSVVDILIDTAGFVWLATQDGLNRFDGKDFTVFPKNFDDVTLPTGNQLGKIIAGTNNELWLITSGGKLEKFNLYTQRFTGIPSMGNKKLPTADITCFEENNTEKWIGTKHEGLYYYNQADKRFLHFSNNSSPVSLADNMIQALFRDSEKNRWVLTPAGITRIKNDLSSSTSFAVTHSSGMTEDAGQNLWLGTFGKGLYLKKKNDPSFTPFHGFGDKDNLPADLIIETLFADKTGRIWIGTYGNGLFIIDNNNRSIQHAVNDKRDPFSLGYNDVLTIRQDKQGGIWIGTDGGGVSYYDERLNNFTTFSKNNLPENISIEQVRSVTTDKEGNTWAGTSNSGLTFLGKDKNEMRTFRFNPFNKGIAHYERIVSLLADDTGDLWIGSQGNGLMIMNGQTKEIKRKMNPDATGSSYFPDHTIWCMLAGENGNVWAGTRNQGLCLINKNIGLIKKLDRSGDAANQLLENNIRTLIYINDSTICIGFENKGLQLLNINTYQLSSINSTAASKLFNGETVIRSTCFRDGILWIGTFGRGLIAIELASGKTINIREPQGLPNNTVYGIEPDESGSLWISTNKGICRMRIPKVFETINAGFFTNFKSTDGLQSNEFNTGAHYKAPDGKLYFGGVNGLTSFDPSRLSRINQSVAVLINQVLVDNQPYTSDTVITYKKLLHFSHSQNSLSFNFAAVDIIWAGSLTYFYQLAGYDDDWIDAGNRNYAAYTNLPPGRYTFRVRAARHFSDNNNPVTLLTIIIDPPFWKKWWFILLCVFAVAGILYGFYRYRISQLMQLQTVRNRIASDLHDDIGSALTNISILSELSRKNIHHEQEATVFLDRISEEVNNSGQALDDIVWSINTDNDSLEQTVARMRRYTAEVFDAAGIAYSLQFDEKFASRKLNMEQRRDFLLIFKELVNNIYKHAHAKNVQIKTGIEKNKLFMNIQDDGRGFDPKEPTHRNGIRNIQQRVNKWNGGLFIDSAPGKGTLTRFNFYIA